MPAAVTPAPIAYIKVVAVKKLVVGYLARTPDPLPSRKCCVGCCFRHLSGELVSSSASSGREARSRSFTLKKLECSKQAFMHLNTLAWNNKIGLWFYFVGFWN